MNREFDRAEIDEPKSPCARGHAGENARFGPPASRAGPRTQGFGAPHRGEGWGGRSGPGGAANVPEKRFCGRCWIQWRRRTSITPANGCERCDWSAACWQATLIGSFRMKAPQPQCYLSHLRTTLRFLSPFGARRKGRRVKMKFESQI
jgi:hypothetical protein